MGQAERMQASLSVESGCPSSGESPPDEETAQQGLRDLMGLLALPALWFGRDGPGVLLLMTEAVERVVDLSMSYAHVPLLPQEPPIDMLRVGGRPAAEETRSAWREVLRQWAEMPIGAASAQWETPIGRLQVVRFSMGYSSTTGSIWFGGFEKDFPKVTQLAYLRAATSLAATGLQGVLTAFEKEQASQAKDEFLAMLGHELRNPLAPISTALELIKRQRMQPLDKYHLIIERQVRHLSRLVDDLLDVSRVARGKINLRREPVRLGSVIARAVESVSPLIEERQHQLVVDVHDGGTLIFGDMTRLTQVFANLLTNAAKYTEPNGCIRIAATVAGELAHVKVTDNGAGIAPELMPRLFSIFQQGRTTIERSRGGLGIGLALVKNLVERHGGAVSVTSDGVGMGSEFAVALPIASQTPASSQARPRRLVADKLDPAHSGVRVLLVDDNQDALESMEAFLLALEFNVATAADPIQALNVAQRFNPHVAVLDIGLPGMDGYQLAEELRARHGEALRLLALSGYGQPDDRKRSAAAGFERHLVKPIDLPDLVAALVPIGGGPKPFEAA